MFEGTYTAGEMVEAIGQEAFDRLTLYTDAVDSQANIDGFRTFTQMITIRVDGDVYKARAVHTFFNEEVMEIELLEDLDWDNPVFEIEQVG